MALEHGGNLLSFQSFNDGAPLVASEGIANGETSDQIGQAGAGHSLYTVDGGASYQLRTNPTSGSVPCLCSGTQVATSNGDVAVEDLRPRDLLLGDSVNSHVLPHVFHRVVSAREIPCNPNLRLILIGQRGVGGRTAGTGFAFISTE